MKVFIEGTPLFRERSGVGQYTFYLTKAMAASAPEAEFTVFGFLFMGKRFKNKPPFPPLKNLRYALVRYFPGKLYNLLFRTFIAPPVDLLLMKKPDIVFFPNFVRWPLIFAKKSVVVVHDISYVSHKEYVAERNRNYLTKFVPPSVKRADAVVAVSAQTKRELIEYYGVPEEKITVASPAIDHALFRPQSEDAIRAARTKYAIPGPYLLFTGTLEPRKNVQGLLQAYRLLPPGLTKRYALVLVGGKGWLDAEIQQKLQELREKGFVIITTGYVPDRDLPALMGGAELFVYPSFYEGFGMPVLEAMACGTPVVASAIPSLSEVAGDAAVLADPTKPAAVAGAIEKVLNSPALQKELKERGLKQAGRYRWEESARAVLELFARLLQKS